MTAHILSYRCIHRYSVRRLKRLEARDFSHVRFTGDDKMVEHFCAALKVVTFAVSLGHDESLIFPQPSYDERIHLYPEVFRKGFIRFSVGLEDPGDIIRDMDQALKAIGL